MLYGVGIGFGTILYALNHSYERSLAGDVANAVAYAAFAVVGYLIAALRPSNAIGWLFGTIALSTVLTFLAEQYGHYALISNPDSLPGGLIAAWVSSWSWVLGVILPSTFLLLLFPSGELLSSRWRPAAWLAAAVTVAYILFGAFSPGPLGGLFPSYVNPIGIESLRSVHGPLTDILDWILLGVFLASVIAAVLRFRRSGGEERQQMKWFAYAAAMMVILFVLNGPFGGPGNLFFGLGIALLPVTTGIAILKYRLYDIDLIINRTLVYGALSVCVIGLYVLVVGGLGVLLQARGNLATSLLATSLVAVLFAPLRERLQRGVNRLMYGERDDPYKVLSRLGQRLEATLTPDAVLPAIVGTVKETLRLPYAAITLAGHDLPTAQAGEPVDAPLRLPLSYQNEPVGELLLGPRTGEEGFSPADRRLLDDLARQAGVTAYAVGLTSDLQRARERLVTAREEERRRLRRDLHDGLGPQLSSQALTIDAVRALMRDDPDAAEKLLVALKAQAQEAVTDIRRLVYELRPPALDDLGLLGALRESGAQYGHNGLAVSVDAPRTLPTLPAAVEVALYRIAQEAMTNVVRHAGARTCAVSLALDDEAAVLRLDVRDDGCGLPDARTGAHLRAGVGLASMRERAEELGGSLNIEALPEGGTVVRAELPLAVER